MKTMRAAVLVEPKRPLEIREVPIPTPERGQILIQVEACGVCRTDLHIADGELVPPKTPLILGHQIVGKVVGIGEGVEGFQLGERVGVPWLGESCGECKYCQKGRENLCDRAIYTGFHRDGGFAEYAVASAQFSFKLTDFNESPPQIAPLLCAGLIGYRSLRMTEDAQKIGFFGFGASAHILAQVIKYQEKEFFAFVRPGDQKGEKFARELGASWAGPSNLLPPEKLDAAIIFAPVGALVPQALRAVDKAGIVVCAGIYMSDIPSFEYRDLWEERVIKSVSNLTRDDGEKFLKFASQNPIQTTVNIYPLEKAQQALDDLRNGNFEGAAVITVF